MSAESNILTGITGVHYVAAFLSHSGLHAVPTTRNVKGPDLIVCNSSGSVSLSIQVKTTKSALRTRGRGEDKHPHHYEWDIGWNSARISSSNVFYALVDLKDFPNEIPDIYIIPSSHLADYFSRGTPETWPRARFHPPLGSIEGYRNNLNAIINIFTNTI